MKSPLILIFLVNIPRIGDISLLAMLTMFSKVVIRVIVGLVAAPFSIVIPSAKVSVIG
jgi:hypothetical protein